MIARNLNAAAYSCYGIFIVFFSCFGGILRHPWNINSGKPTMPSEQIKSI